MEKVEDVLEILFQYYNVASVAQLSSKINTSQKTISNWKVRNSINAIKKKCRELGIYNEIFRDINKNINNLQGSNFENAVAVNNGYTKNIKSNNYENIDENILKLVDILYSGASEKNKINELKKDLTNLLNKYM